MSVLESGPGPAFDLAVDNALGDAQQRRLRYHLLRLTVVGLGRQDVADLAELGRCAFLGLPTAGHVDAIRQRSDAGALAVAIADVVSAAPGAERTRDVFLGAVLGAYAGIHGLTSTDKESAAILGALGGAIATTANSFIQELLADTTPEDYLRMDD